jgi:hypothetical protein
MDMGHKEATMARKFIHLVLSVFIVSMLVLSALPAGSAEAASEGVVTGQFIRNGLALTITSTATYEELWVLQINYCDGTSESIGRNSRRNIFGQDLSAGYTFYAEKPMQRVVISSLPIGRLSAAPNFRSTQVRRSCGSSPVPAPRLACRAVKVASSFRRTFEGQPISFTSNARVYFAGLKFPGVDGLASAKVASYKAKYFAPSIRFDYKNRVWSGTFLSRKIPTGTYQHVMLIVEDIYGNQAKCPVGEITVLP